MTDDGAVGGKAIILRATTVIHAKLKRETSGYHQVLGRKLGFLMGPLTLTDYAALLERFFGFYAPVEARLAMMPEWEPPYDFRARRKVQALAEDLRWMGRDEEDLAGLPVCADLPAMRTAAEALGCLYVLEGSTLGGRIIASHLGRSLGLGVEGGCAFFRSYGDAVGTMWASFLLLLSRHCEDREEAEVVVESARQTFASLDRWLSPIEEDRCPSMEVRSSAMST